MNKADQRLDRFFVRSAAALLLCMATALFVSNSFEKIADLIPIREPLLGLELPKFYWILGALCVAVSLPCLFSANPRGAVPWLAWLASNFLVWRAGLYWSGAHTLAGYLGSFSNAFAVPPWTASVILDVVIGYLVIGSCLLLLWPVVAKRAVPVGDFLKGVCPKCAGHVAFPEANVGKEIPCPHCQTVFTLRQEKLKMSCYFCKGHIEFPSHAIGTKMQCPHCKKDITLLERMEAQPQASPKPA
jgi:hypothetical protein